MSLYKFHTFQFIFILLLTGITMSGQITGKGYQYLSPVPDARYVSPSSILIMRFEGAKPADLTNLQQMIQLTGSESGRLSGETAVASDGRTIIFNPYAAFHPGEMVDVGLVPAFRRNVPVYPIRYSFTVSSGSAAPTANSLDYPEFLTPADSAGPLKKPYIGEPRILSNGISVPGDFPVIDININDNPDSGHIFINHRGSMSYQLILNNDGLPYWYWKVPDDRRDFKPQPNGWMTMMVRNGYGGTGDGFIALDDQHEYVKTFRAGNGYSTDEHELIVLPDSGYLLIGLREEPVDMSQYVSGGRVDATVRETCIQEYTKNDQLIFQWRAWDHFDIRDMELESLTASFIRFPHMNAIWIDEDGHILLSTRHLSEVTKIHRQTGEILWRLSGANNQFTFINDPLNGFHNQHAVRATGNSHYTVFDNGNLHSPPQSRAVEYAIDTTAMTATLAWKFDNDRPAYQSYYMGNTQRLQNGNTLINWAISELPKLSEITPAGQKAYEMTFADGTHVYRTFKEPWHGINKRPYLIVEPDNEFVTLIFNKFGDKDIAYYNIYAGLEPNPENIIDTAHVTMKHLSELENDNRYYFRVTAVSGSGQESDFSNEESVDVRFILPGQNLIQNGDFTDQKNHWSLDIYGSASASSEINASGEYQINIVNGGTETWHVQLLQPDIPLIQGRKYRFEFDAFAASNRLIYAQLERNGTPYENYGKIGPTFILQAKAHYAYEFIMEDASDFQARVVFNCGNDAADIYLDNISVREVIETGMPREDATPSEYQLYGNYPNPFNSSTTFHFYLPEKSRTEIVVYDLQGRRVKKISDNENPAGPQRVRFDGSVLGSGIYLYRLEAKSLTSRRMFRHSGKMILIK